MVEPAYDFGLVASVDPIGQTVDRKGTAIGRGVLVRASSILTTADADGARCHGGANWAKIGVSECRFQIPHSLGAEQSTERLLRCASRAKRKHRSKAKAM